jgi:hypothetical protein
MLTPYLCILNWFTEWRSLSCREYIGLGLKQKTRNDNENWVNMDISVVKRNGGGWLEKLQEQRKQFSDLTLEHTQVK